MAFTPIPIGSLNWGPPVNAAFTDQDARITSLETRRTFVRKTADESVVSSTVIQPDNELLVPVVAGNVYVLEGYIVYNAPTAAGITLRITTPGGSGVWTFVGLSNSGGTVDTGSVRMSANSSGVASARVGGAANDIAAVLRGTVVPSVSGNVQFEWAQQAANASPTVVRTNSWMYVERVA